MGKDSEKVAYFGRGGGVSTTDTFLWGYGISQALFGCVGSEKCSTAYAYSDAGAYCGAFGTGYGWVSVVLIDCKHYYPNMILPKYDCMLTFLFHFYSLVPSITNHHRIAFTGSGKTLSFSLPLVMAAMEEEARMPLVAGEGPVGIVLAPSRELARQTYDIVCEFCTAIRNANNNPEGGRTYPVIRCQLLIGGESARDQLQPFRDEGVHCVVATPGRLRDFLKKRSINLDICRYICLDEADRMLDLGFDEEVGEIMNHFHHQRQTILYSATFPKKFQDFAKKTLVKPIVVNVGRAGAANLDVIQEVEYVKQEAKIVYLLECLQKTAPPVVIFCEKKGDVDDIHEYLLLKGVEAVSIHGGKDQEERNEAISLYKEGKKDVLVATDVAAKGLDFADIQHVINFDMPSEIENYVHRIGRTGRCGKTGVATTFINKSCEETTLLDLKHLLKEAHQRIPPVLMIMDDPLDNVGTDGGPKGCSFCGGLGHTIVDCPKIDKDARRVAGGRRDALATGDGYGGEI